jgi:hypothetical protein
MVRINRIIVGLSQPLEPAPGPETKVTTQAGTARPAVGNPGYEVRTAIPTTAAEGPDNEP